MLEELIKANYELSVATIVILSIWSGIWKLTGLWYSGKNRQKVWFIFMGIFNTAGILPIIYLMFFRKKGEKNGN